MHLNFSGIVTALTAVLLMTVSVHAAVSNSAPEIVRIWPSGAPGTTDWAGPETDTPIVVEGAPPLHIISNVTSPTLVVVRPTARTANGTGMIVIPGGGFQELWLTHEGYMVAQWLTARGITAFILKYRVRPSKTFQLPSDVRHHPEQFEAMSKTFEAKRQLAIADASQAMRYLRANAGHYAIAANRIGMIGFSAGAITTMGVILEGPQDARPNFAAPIYGAMGNEAPPKDGPPLFIAATQDDSLVPVAKSVEIFSRWNGANLPAEIHIYEHGEHGFGMLQKGRPVDDWAKAFEAWLRIDGWLTKKSL